MMREEQYIEHLAGRREHFQVPEGYFSQLTKQVMRQLPERKPRGRMVSLRPWLAAAASILVILVLTLTVMPRGDNNTKMASVAAHSANVAHSAAAVDDSYMDEAADYALIDNDEIYACLSDN